jgi:hypothetical protein
VNIFCTTFRLCDEKEPFVTVLQEVGKLRIKSGCKESIISVSQASCTVMRNVTLKGGDLLTQNSTLHDCWEELGLKFNISQLSVDVKLNKRRLILTI